MCIPQRLTCGYFQAPLLKTLLSVVHSEIYFRHEHSPAGNSCHFHRSCCDGQKDVPGAGLRCRGHLIPPHAYTEGHGRGSHHSHPAAAAGGEKLCTQCITQWHTEKLWWKSTRPRNVGSMQNHRLHPRSEAAQGTEIHKRESLLLTPSFLPRGDGDAQKCPYLD